MVFRRLLWGPIHGRPSLDQGSEGFGFDVQVGGNGNVGRAWGRSLEIQVFLSGFLKGPCDAFSQGVEDCGSTASFFGKPNLAPLRGVCSNILLTYSSP